MGRVQRHADTWDLAAGGGGGGGRAGLVSHHQPQAWPSHNRAEEVQKLLHGCFERILRLALQKKAWHNNLGILRHVVAMRPPTMCYHSVPRLSPASWWPSQQGRGHFSLNHSTQRHCGHWHGPRAVARATFPGGGGRAKKTLGGASKMGRECN